MIVAHTLQEFLQSRSQLQNHSVALVPTMGALHEGHIAVIKKAKELSHYCIVTIFVNQLQFDQLDDYLRYPKTEENDIRLLEKNQVDLVWLPKAHDIYSKNFCTRIVIEGPALNWEGAVRKGHFSGVATLVNRLFSLIKPTIACFGEKDWQQLQVIKRMVEDLNIPVTIFGVPIVREKNGLAKSSRNKFLTPDEHEKASLLYKTLQNSYQKIQNNQNISKVLEEAVQTLESEGFKVDYYAAVNSNTMTELRKWCQDGRLIAAAKLGSVRLIDNM